MSAKVQWSDDETEFLRFVEKTGRPQDWRLISRTRPPTVTDFTVVCPFEVSETRRKTVSMVPCALCRPTGPKYWSGYFVRFPAEGDTYRLVGHVCGSRHLGSGFDEQVTALKVAAADAKAGDFLLNHLPEIAKLKAAAEAIAKRNRELDGLRSAFVGIVTRAGVKRLLREGVHGVLTITEGRLVSAVGTNGRETQRYESVPVATLPVDGLEFLRRPQSGEARALNAVRTLRSFPDDDDDIQEALIEWGRTEGERDAAKQRLQRAWQDLQGAVEFATHATAFFSRATFESLARWTEHKSCPLKANIGVDQLGRLCAAMPGGTSFRCEMRRPCLVDPLPTYPDLVD